MTNKHGRKKIQAATGVNKELLTVVKKQKRWWFDHMWARGYQTFFMLKSAARRNLHGHKYKNTKKIKHFSGSDKPRLLFFLLLNANNCWHFNINEQEKFHAQLS